jgi:hypothetical protein
VAFLTEDLLLGYDMPLSANVVNVLRLYTFDPVTGAVEPTSQTVTLPATIGSSQSVQIVPNSSVIYAIDASQSATTGHIDVIRYDAQAKSLTLQKSYPLPFAPRAIAVTQK